MPAAPFDDPKWLFFLETCGMSTEFNNGLILTVAQSIDAVQRGDANPHPSTAMTITSYVILVFILYYIMSLYLFTRAPVRCSAHHVVEGYLLHSNGFINSVILKIVDILTRMVYFSPDL